MLKVLHVATSDIGGAHEAALRIHRALIDRGIVSDYLSLFSSFDEENKFSFYQLTRYSNIISKIKNYYKKIIRYKTIEKYIFFDKGIYRINNYRKLINKVKRNHNIIIFYWTSQFINPKVLYELNKYTKARVFIYLTDMAPMTGGCHFTWDCKGYENNCGKCPALISNHSNDLSFRIMKNKQRYLLHSDITILAPNQWIGNRVLKSKLFKEKNIKEVLFGIDKKFFIPKDKQELRKKYEKSKNINKTVLLFVAKNLVEERKGFSYFIESINKLFMMLSISERQNIKIIIIGKKVLNTNIKFEVDYYNKVTYPLLVDMYNIADYYISTSIEDLGPFTIMESLMCGTPVISFNTGIASQIITNGLNGWCVENKNINELSIIINRAINIKNDEYSKISKNARLLAIDNFEKDTQMDKLISILSAAS